MVGLAGFEPATSRPPDERATKLRYSPTHISHDTRALRLSVDVSCDVKHFKRETHTGHP